MQAKEYLLQVKYCDIRIKNKMLEKEQWWTIANGSSIALDAERVQTSPKGDKLENAVFKIIEIEKEIDEMIDEFVELKQKVTRTIEMIDEPKEYDILHKLYIQMMKPNEVADSLNYTYQWMNTLHNRALDKIQVILDSKKL